jgi:uncharacterized protein (TIGR00255 family)
MTGFAQVKGQHEDTAFTLSLKAVNHRFLDLHLRLPMGSDLLEQALRRVLKTSMSRGHVEVTLQLERAGACAVSVNRELVSGYVHAFRRTAAELNVPGDPDLNAIFRLNGVLAAAAELPSEEAFQQSVVKALEEGIERLNEMREHEGHHTAAELRLLMQHIDETTSEIERLRSTVLDAYVDKVQARIQELIGAQADRDRILQEAALLADRSDIQEEVVRMKTHVRHFDTLLTAGNEVGKKLDFLLQEMNREANTMLSKTGGLTGEALRITELGLALKADIEKSREQVQNVE